MTNETTKTKEKGKVGRPKYEKGWGRVMRRLVELLQAGELDGQHFKKVEILAEVLSEASKPLGSAEQEITNRGVVNHCRAGQFLF